MLTDMPFFQYILVAFIMTLNTILYYTWVVWAWKRYGVKKVLMSDVFIAMLIILPGTAFAFWIAAYSRSLTLSAPQEAMAFLSGTVWDWRMVPMTLGWLVFSFAMLKKLVSHHYE